MSTSLQVFAYLNADRADAYRAIMRLFINAKTRFALHLRPADIRAALKTEQLSGIDDLDVESALSQLCEWENLEVHPDTSDVATVEDFYRPRHLYQLTSQGEAAERAITYFFDTLKQPGELQATALDDISVLLGELCQLARQAEADESKIHRTLKELASRFEELTSRAHSFIGSLQRTIDLHGLELEAFLAYKQLLIEYLERFIGELTVSATEIAERLQEVENHGVDRLLQIAAARDLVDAFNPTDAVQLEAVSAWQDRWIGLRSWFLRQSGRQSQAEILRARARSAIPALLNAVAAIHDRRTTRSDRAADLRTLARWFAETDNDRQPHQLWQAAFALFPARHLRVEQETLDLRDDDPVVPSTSWLDAPPIVMSPRLRQTGRHAPRGPAKAIIDRSREKQLVTEAMAAEAEQLQAARQRLATGGTFRLSEIGFLNSVEFSLFLDMLGEALSRRVSPGDPVVATSSDGSLQIRLTPAKDGQLASVETEHGIFRGQDYYLQIIDTLSSQTDVGEISGHAHKIVDSDEPSDCASVPVA